MSNIVNCNQQTNNKMSNVKFINVSFGAKYTLYNKNQAPEVM
jgi:hypothetical protein